MTQKLIMCRGLPWSGKSTWSRKEAQEKHKTIRFNNDEFRNMTWLLFTREVELYLTQSRNYFIEKYINDWYDVIVDNTNLNPIHEQIYKELSKKLNVEFEIKEFAVDIDTCIERDKKRENSVGRKVIEWMAKQWNYYPSVPTEFEKVTQSFGRDAFIFDIDGTLAYMQGRSPYDYTKVSTDWCYKDVAEMSNLLKDNWFDIIICSWRKYECRKETEEWLATNNISYNELLMRKLDDNRKDSIVKYEILVNEILPKYYVKWVFDDRNQVVKMWREAGLRCYQVAEWNF